MVDALASDRTDQPFGEAVLPRRAWGDGLVTDAHGAQPVRDGSAVDAIPITDQVARRLSPRECFGDLACDPVRGRMGCDVDPDKVSADQPNDDEGIEQVEANARNNEQVHGGDVRCVVTQEGAPSLTRRSTSLDYVLRDAANSLLNSLFSGNLRWRLVRSRLHRILDCRNVVVRLSPADHQGSEPNARSSQSRARTGVKERLLTIIIEHAALIHRPQLPERTTRPSALNSRPTIVPYVRHPKAMRGS